MKILCMDDNLVLAQALAERLGGECLVPEHRLFPDGEHYFRLNADLEYEDIVISCHLHQPNDKALALWLMVGHLREMGVKSIGLVAPYLAYMRQDIRFLSGECITSRHFAQLLNQSMDYLITVDPHLHRYQSLDEIYQIPSRVIHANKAISYWIKRHIPDAIIIGPDEESAQWAKEIAELSSCPVQVFKKTRLGDHHVEIEIPDVELLRNYQPILVDDIISTGRTLIETAHGLVRQGIKPPICIGVHAVLAEGALEAMNKAVQDELILDWLTCNTIPSVSNQIDLTDSITDEILAIKGGIA